MRGGKLLAEESPDSLLMQYQCDTLEDVFVKLAVLQNKGKRCRAPIKRTVSVEHKNPLAMMVSSVFAIHALFSLFSFIIYQIISRIRHLIPPKRIPIRTPVNLAIIAHPLPNRLEFRMIQHHRHHLHPKNNRPPTTQN